MIKGDDVNKTTEKKKSDFNDALLTAYLDSRGFSVRAKAVGGQVTFEVTGAHLDDAVQDYYSNPNVPVLTFVQSYKKIKSMFYNCKGNI